MFQFLLDIDMEKVDFDDDETLLKMRNVLHCTLSISLYFKSLQKSIKVLSKVSGLVFQTNYKKKVRSIIRLIVFRNINNVSFF